MGIVPNEFKRISFVKLNAVTNFVGNGGKSFYSINILKGGFWGITTLVSKSAEQFSYWC